MDALRRIINGHVPIAWLVLALTLGMKFAVPVGFMPQISENGVQLIVCDGMAAPSTVAHAMHAHHHHGHDAPAKSDAPCPFAGLAAPAIGGTDPVQLAIALAAIIIVGLSAVAAIRVAIAGHIRPPLRGPPLPA